MTTGSVLEILLRRDAFHQRAVHVDAELVPTPADLDDRARHLRAPAKDDRLQSSRAIRRRAVVLEIRAPGLAKLLLGDPLLEHAVEPLAHAQQLVLETALGRAPRARVLVRDLQPLVVARERLELFAKRQRLQLHGPESTGEAGEPEVIWAARPRMRSKRGTTSRMLACAQ